MFQENPGRALAKRVDKIIFFGHSLAKADYSYFQSIFDFYNLYGDTLLSDSAFTKPFMLQFYFTIFDISRETEISRDAAASVYKLITAYGDTIDNKDRGKNLLHKLLLEGRIKIDFIENI